jgi:MraZ protein
MFIGEYSHKIDARGRVNIPSKLREEVDDKFYLTKGLDKCLFLFPEEEWKIFEEKLKILPLTDRNARAFVRMFFAGAVECIIDKQGRINVPNNLIKHSEINKEVMIIGVGQRIELWSKENWEDYNEPNNISYDEIAEKMAELGI